MENLLPQDLLIRYGKNLQKEFIDEYTLAIEQAKSLVAGRESSRNSVFSIPEMFPYGLEGILSLCAIKVNRTIGDIKVGDFFHGKSEAEDLLNYAAFFVAYFNLIERVQDVSSTHSTNSGTLELQRAEADTFSAVSPTSGPRVQRVLPRREE